MKDIKKVLVCITPQSNSKRLINKGDKLAKSIHAELHILHVEQGNNILNTEESPLLLQELFNYGAELGGVIHAVCGEDIREAIKSFLKTEKITNVVFGEHKPNSALTGREIYNEIREGMPYIEVTILERGEDAESVFDSLY